MKRILLETSFSKIYILVVSLITVIILGGYFSYAMFTVSKEKSNAISIVVGNLTYKLSVDGTKGNRLTVPANSSKEFVVTLSNPNNRAARFNFYYTGTLKSGTDTGYVVKSGYNTPPVATGVNLQKSGTSGSTNTYLIRVSNTTTSSVTINLGVSVGLDYNNLSLPSNGHLFRKITSTGIVADVIEDDIMNRLNYTDSEQTFVTGSDPYNYIWYSGKLWRAVSIDPSDNSVKLITEWNMASFPYDDTSTAFDGSFMEAWLNDTSVDGFLYNLRKYTTFIKTNSVWNATRTSENTKPAKTTMVTDAVGLLNLYEYVMSYSGTDYTNGYLNNGLWWRLLNGDSNDYVYTITDTGFRNRISPTYLHSVRPAINLKGTIKIVEGRGTESDPYRLEGDNDKNLNGTLLNTRYSGEYIRFGTGVNNLYRIVSHETSGLTKITSAEPLKSSSSFVTSAFGTNNTFSSSNTIGTFLNTTYLTASNGYLTSAQINMINSSTWYLGAVYTGYNYRLAKYTTATGTTTTTSTTARVGLLRTGELMSGQYERSLVKGGSTSTNLTTSYWLITKQHPTSGTSTIINASAATIASATPSTTRAGIKPALNLKATVVITGGVGTKEDPFEIAIS